MAKGKWEVKYEKLHEDIACALTTLHEEYDKAGEHYKKAKEAGETSKLIYWLQYRKGLKKAMKIYELAVSEQALV